VPNVSAATPAGGDPSGDGAIVTGVAANTSFLPGVGRWADALGGLRNTVRQELVGGQLAEAVGRRAAGTPLRVLDVGCGQGTQALRLAQAGHHVTGVDISEDLLDRFGTVLSAQPADVRARVHLVHGPGEAAGTLTPGPFDLVLCHGVLMYLDDPVPMLRALAAVVADGALVSLLVRNGIAPAMRDGLRGRWADAAAAFDSARYVNRLGLAARGHAPEDIDAVVAPLGWNRERWYGVRVFTDHREQADDLSDELERVIAVEREAGRRDPYRAVAALLHLLYRTPPKAAAS
jgi:S-adenosylmethionine-dependent methyltransferase